METVHLTLAHNVGKRCSCASCKFKMYTVMATSWQSHQLVRLQYMKRVHILRPIRYQTLLRATMSLRRSWKNQDRQLEKLRLKRMWINGRIIAFLQS